MQLPLAQLTSGPKMWWMVRKLAQSVYIFIRRSVMHPMQTVFDAPMPLPVVPAAPAQ